MKRGSKGFSCDFQWFFHDFLGFSDVFARFSSSLVFTSVTFFFLVRGAVLTEPIKSRRLLFFFSVFLLFL